MPRLLSHYRSFPPVVVSIERLRQAQKLENNIVDDALLNRMDACQGKPKPLSPCTWDSDSKSIL